MRGGLRFLRVLTLVTLLAGPGLAQTGPDTCATLSPDQPPFRILTETPASGAALALAWADPAPDPTACAGPRFLVLSLPERIRFAGAGFIALPPGAKAPYEITHAQDRMRVFIPLHDPGHSAGQLDLLPWLTRDLTIDWALVGVPEGPKGTAPAQVLTGAPVTVALAAGQPRLVVQDPFDTTPPQERILSNSGEFLLEVHDGRYRVLDARTGALIHAAAGFEPNFSPGSRFLHAVGPAIMVEGEEGDPPFLRADLSVVDLFAEQEVLRIGGTGGARSSFLHRLIWGTNDAFLFVGFTGDGGLAMKQMLHDDRPLITNHLGCGACSGTSEDGLAEWHPNQGLMKLGSLAGHVESYDLIDLVDPARNRLFDYDEFTSAEVPDATGAVMRFDLTSEKSRSWALYNPSDELLPESVITHRRVEGRALNETLAELVQAGSGQSRGGVALGAAGQINPLPRALTRLVEFGIDLHAPPPLLPPPSESSRAALEDPEEEEGWDAEAFYDDDGNPNLELLRAFAARPHDCAATLPARQSGDLSDDQARRLCAAESVMLHDEGFEVCHASEAHVWTLAVSGRVSIIHQRICRTGSASGAHGLVTWLHHDRDGPRAALLSGAPTLFYHDFGDEAGADTDDPFPNPRPRGVLSLFADARLAVFALSPDRLAIAGRDRRIVVIDPARAAVETEITTPTAAEDIETMRQTADGRHLLHLDHDGRFHLFAFETGAGVLSGLHVDDEIVVTDGDLRFDSTPEGASFVQVKFPGDPVLFPLANLGAQRRVTGLIDAHLGFAPRLGPASPIGLPPRAEIVAQEAASVTLHLAAPGGLAALALFRDGQRISETPLTGTRAEITLPLPALPETRWFAIQLRDMAGLQSRAIVLPRGATGGGTKKPKGHLHVLAIGTDHYDDPAITPLRFAAADARAFAAAIETAGRYSGISAEVLIDTPDLTRVLMARLGALKDKMQAEDTLFVHIAGHGYADQAGRLHLAHRETRLADLTGSALGFDDLAAALARLPGRVVVLLDACHSGAAASMSNDEAVNVFLGQDRPIAVVAASKGRQLSFESAALRGGAFTSAITTAIADPMSDLDGNGSLELDELYARIKSEVVRATQGAQTPWIAQSGFVGPVPLY
jgi:hypothetical protein